MARKHRIHYPGAFYHVINRGNQRKDIFWTGKDYRSFLNSFSIVQDRYPFKIHAYCLMPNHFHLLLEVETVPLSIVMRSLLTRYAKYFNFVHRKVGHVFQGRYRAILCQKENFLLELVRYIHMNPVRARITRRPEQWEWSSHRAYIGNSAPAFLYRKDVWGQFKKNPVRNFSQFVMDRSTLDSKKIYSPELFPILGDKDFTKSVPHSQEPRRRASHFAIKRHTLAQLLHRITGGEKSQRLDSPVRPRSVSRMRAQLVYAAIRFCEISPAKVANFLKLSPSAITRCYRRFHKEVQQDSLLEENLFNKVLQ